MGLKDKGGLINFLLLKKKGGGGVLLEGGLFERGLIEDLGYVYTTRIRQGEGTKRVFI